jgi:hypothetical protein
MVRPQTLGGVIQEFVRIFPRPGQPVQQAALQHFFGTFSFTDLLSIGAPGLLPSGPRSALNSARVMTGPYDGTILVCSLLSLRMISIASTRPPIQAPGEVVQRGIPLRRRNVTDGNEIRRFEEDVNVPAGMRERQVAVVDLFAPCWQTTPVV